ncbi:related to putative methyltransferase [Cephalotrichum gorgonifer]|uniref:Alpha N-terminal protein methyltransferase 1 n=1 Tax=Cephalotrichum gorgonifer TaxID=2041049 RepID=A0AAE8T0K9_9PEZI|nr:related to putative methyltransferase [Cephalotrichum gorgonifer]
MASPPPDTNAASATTLTPSTSTIPDSSVGGDTSLQYWGSTGAYICGMLGGIPDVQGFSPINKIDLQGSRNFLAKLGIGLKQDRRRVKTALELGAGIRRVTEGLLLHVADEVDVVEPVAKLTAALQGKPGIHSIDNVGVAEWRSREGASYDLIWIQWCLGYATDAHVVDHLRRCRAVLEPENGIIVVKENLSTRGEDILDETDASITRQVI